MQEELEILEDRPKNEAECRLQINRLFYHCLKVERYALADAANPPPNLPSFALETSISLEVVHNGVRKMLKGDMDYSMKYAKDNIAAGLVVLEAKNLRTMSLGLSQCLAYMAMINVIRRRDGYMNAAIYGIISNGRDFQFLRIDNDSEWCEWRPERPWCNMTKDMIYTMLRLVIRNAVMSSPRVSSQLVRCISPSHPLTPHPDLYHLQVESDDSEDDDNEDNDGIDLGE
ncbi:hypothetical protein BJX63DRAFT_98759 [Aspergillus granulosus]|uniref:Uncharacterized protein n=1 Tax=Aspergillus granulosus TaxID=176169 RepID=A0ABR4GUL6_9EURO